uniref:UDP-N-acetylenolpyruvoylglucosamine reductase n=1 Tax=candidate division WOR-3 bacterium TaxID=2052148 RepID=A0A7C6EJ71_UNCW3
MKNLFKEIKGIKVFENEPLKNYSSLRIGGNARYLIKIYNLKALLKTIELINKWRLKFMVIGEGTNILFPDKGFNGVVIKLMGEFRKIDRTKNIFLCGGGALIKDFINKAVESGYSGMEFLAGIPGSIGGAVKGNAGAFGKSISEIVKRVSILDSKARVKKLSREKIKFAYRYSSIPDNSIIFEVELRLRRGEKKTTKRKIKELLKMRWQKQPKGLSAGSFFKNPKPLSAGRLIEECGLKGLRVGDAVISKKHANFIINLGEAKAEDVLNLVKIVKKRVKEIKGVELEPEVRILK